MPHEEEVLPSPAHHRASPYSSLTTPSLQTRFGRLVYAACDLVCNALQSLAVVERDGHLLEPVRHSRCSALDHCPYLLQVYGTALGDQSGGGGVSWDSSAATAQLINNMFSQNTVGQGAAGGLLSAGSSGLVMKNNM